MKAWLNRARRLLVVSSATLAVAACDERLEGGLACPALCPTEPSVIRDTTLFPVAFDTTIAGFPPFGSEAQLLLATRGDTLDVRAIIRFDTLFRTFRHPSTPTEDSDIVFVDSASIRLLIAAADTLGPAVTVEVYDVDIGGAGEDTVAAALLAAFVPERLLGSRTFEALELQTALEIPIDNARLLAIIQGDTLPRLRVGLRMTSPGSAHVTFFSANSVTAAPVLSYRPSPDEEVPALEISPLSRTPDLQTVRTNISDFQVVAQGPTLPTNDLLRVGGVPGMRPYILLNVPTGILDSANIVRATLQLTQRPNPDAPAAGDSMAFQVYRVTAGGAVQDLPRLLLFLAGTLDSIHVVPQEGGVREIEITTLLRAWSGTSPDRTPRAIALRSVSEGTGGYLADFYSNDAPDALRPRLRITYVPQPPRGLP